MGIRKIDINLCDGCGTCIKYCPMDVIRLDKEEKVALIQYLRDCQSCFLCESECPQEAITCVAVHERRIPRAW